MGPDVNHRCSAPHPRKSRVNRYRYCLDYPGHAGRHVDGTGESWVWTYQEIIDLRDAGYSRDMITRLLVAPLSAKTQ